MFYDADAICLHLCDSHLTADLAPKVGTATRAFFTLNAV